MSDIVQDNASTLLSPAEIRLAATLAKPKRIALGCVVALTALGWLALGLMSSRLPLSWQMLCQTDGAVGLSGFGIAAGMWLAMVLAMMLPTAAPMILTYAEIADTAARKREPVVSPMVLTAGYVAVWFGAATVAASLQYAVSAAGLEIGNSAARLLGGMMFIGAGLYQFSALKQACLSVCQRPFPFYFANWTTETDGVFKLGLRQGVLCLGCCWAMMALMFATGAMNVLWMAALGVVMTIEKISSTPRFSHAAGFAFVAAGVGLVGTAWT